MTATLHQSISENILINLSGNEGGIPVPVGFWIVISRSNFWPSFVNVICPDPSTSILRVPEGPRFDFRTSCRPKHELAAVAKAGKS